MPNKLVTDCFRADASEARGQLAFGTHLPLIFQDIAALEIQFAFLGKSAVGSQCWASSRKAANTSVRTRLSRRADVMQTAVMYVHAHTRQ